MKIPFDIKFRPQIESGEYKVETRDGRPVRIVCYNREYGCPVMALATEADGHESYVSCNFDGRVSRINEYSSDLFIITPEPELTSWQTFISGCLQKYGLLDCGAADRIAKECSAELLELARKELEPEVLERLEAAYKNQDEVVYENGKRDGKAEALRTRATELTENLTKSGLDKDSIPYHLIEFMCNLYTCQNWEEIEETAEAYATRFKAAVMKDLPRWKKCEHEMHTLTHLLIRSIDAMWIGAYVKDGQYYIPTNDLILKLPGFEE